MKISKKKGLVLAAGALGSVIGSGSNVFAAQNHEGICQIETKTGEFSFNASGKEITTTKPMDLLVIIDGSASMSNEKAHTLFATTHALLKSLPDDSRVMFAVYSTNESSSYRHSGNNTMSRLLTKDEAVSMVKKLDEGYPAFGGEGSSLISEIKAQNAGFGNMGSMYGDVFAGVMRPNYIHSVIQVTDAWAEAESIDEMFASWAKKNAKTFMSVVINDGPDSKSVREMQRVGHPNIYVTGNKDQNTINKEVINQFNTTATEKAQPKTTINVTAEQGLTLKEVKLVSPDGKEENLAINNNKVNIEKDLPQDGKWTVKVKADGLVHETKKVTATASIGGREVGKTELVFEGCKDAVPGKDEEKMNVDIPFETVYKPDETLTAGEQKVEHEGVKGIKEIKKVWETINKQRKGDPKITETITKQKEDKVIRVGTKPKIVTENTNFSTIYKANANLDYGVKKVIKDGHAGGKTVKTTYTLRSNKGPEIDEHVGKPEILEKEDRIVEIGTKPKIVTEDVPFATRYQGNANLRAGIQNILKQGKTGTKTTTTTYTLKSETSDATDTHIGNPVVVAGEDRLIEVGIKPETTVTNLPYDTEYNVNYTKKQGTPDVVIRKGVNGSKATTTTYTLDEKSGLVSRHEGNPTVVNPTNEIIEQYKGRETKYVSGGKDIAPSVISKNFDMKKAIKSFIFEDEDISGVTKTYTYVPELTTKHVDTKTGKELSPAEVGKKFGEKHEFDEYEFKGETTVGNVKTYSYYKGPKIIQRFFNPQGEKVKPDYTIYNRKVGDIINVGHPWGIDYKGVRLYPTLSKLPNEVVEVKDQDIIIDYIYDKPVPGEPNVPLATESNTLSVKNTCPPQHVVGAKKLPPRIVIKND